VPWLDAEIHALREELFAASLDLHRAFIGAAAQRILHNLSALFDLSKDAGKGDPNRRALLPDLWSTLFMIVPVLSTTFASVDRMLDKLGPESIGWLLVDEAGQALPQAAVGAIMRSKRAIVVGDPIQIPPVVTLPQHLIEEIARFFRVDVDEWAAPTASAQTRADKASRFQSVFTGDTRDRRVGVPLLVHRRCEEPMFGISNAIAYNGKMVSQVMQTDGGPIRAVLGPSRWIDVEGDASSKWCALEGEKIVELLGCLANHGVKKPDIFIVTPFRIIANEMRIRLKRETALFASLHLDLERWIFDNVGTVDTVQGREADTVIFVLGAPKPAQNGARQWAGTPPNLANVAVSRAKRNLYVVGSRSAWRGAGSFAVLAQHL
jgi:superfamily I DNA and/or RNA helicase